MLLFIIGPVVAWLLLLTLVLAIFRAGARGDARDLKLNKRLRQNRLLIRAERSEPGRLRGAHRAPSGRV
jgi:hypothetical protein